jgi:SAM-dependent methyltransferase
MVADKIVPSREFHWVSAVDRQNSNHLIALERRMAEFYATSKTYYLDIDFCENNWIQHPLWLDLVSRLEDCGKIIEAGCGAANLLRHHGRFESHYFGCDFSRDLLGKNRERYPRAHFEPISDPKVLPFSTGSADAVFSIFVIEHVVFPQCFLDECVRVLRPGGLFALICPDFLGRSWMASQRTGFSHGTGREKLRKGRVIDAVITGYDTRSRMPRRIAELRQQASHEPKFFINLAPVCLDPATPFGADHDAVYLTYAPEIINYLRPHIRFEVEQMNTGAPNYDPIYLVGHKV